MATNLNLYSFIDDPQWTELDDNMKQSVLNVAFDRDITSDSQWESLSGDMKSAVRNIYFDDARGYEQYSGAPEKRGLLGKTFSSLGRGAADAIGMAGHALELADLTPREIDEKTGLLDKMARGIIDWSEKTQESDLLRPSKRELRGEHGFMERGILGGLRALPLSASPWATAGAGALIGAATPVPGGMAIGATVGGLVGLVTMFGAGTYGQDYKTIYDELSKNPDVSEEEKRESAHRGALTSAEFETGTELAQDVAALFMFGGSKVLTTPLKATLKNMIRKPIGTLAKGTLKQMPIEVGGEMVAGGGQAWAHRREGILSGPTIGEGVKESIIPAMVLSLFMGAGATGLNRVQTRSIIKQLNSDNIDERRKAADLMTERIAANTNDTSLATVWRQAAEDTIQKGERFDFNEKLVDFASVKMAEDIEIDQRETTKPDPIDEIGKAETADDAIRSFNEAVSSESLEKPVFERPEDIEARLSRLGEEKQPEPEGEILEKALDKEVEKSYEAEDERKFAEEADTLITGEARETISQSLKALKKAKIDAVKTGDWEYHNELRNIIRKARIHTTPGGKDSLRYLYNEFASGLPEPAELRKIEVKVPEEIDAEAKAPEVVEKEKAVHDYSNTQVNLPEESAKPIKEFGRKIPDKELYTEPDDDTYGREEAPHITVRYGLETSNPEDVAPAFKDIGPIKVKFGKISIFESDDYDVVKVDIESPDLEKANKRVGETVKLPGETFKDYKPHATIAYVKKGEGKKYVGDKSLEGQEAVIDSIFLSAKDGKMHEIKLEPTPSPEKTEVALEGKGVEEKAKPKETKKEKPEKPEEPEILFKEGQRVTFTDFRTGEEMKGNVAVDFSKGEAKDQSVGISGDDGMHHFSKPETIKLVTEEKPKELPPYKIRKAKSQYGEQFIATVKEGPHKGVIGTSSNSEDQAIKELKKAIEQREKLEPEPSIHQEIATKVKDHLIDTVHDKPLGPKKLQAWADKAFGGTMADGKYSIKDMYDAMELGVNQAILEKSITANEDVSRANDAVRMLKRMIVRLPTQTKRTEEMDEFQQFSTPPPLAYVANWAANINKDDVYLEPSAGIGGLAVFGKKAGAKKVAVNELSDARSKLLNQLGFDEQYSEDAAQLNNLPVLKDLNPSVIVMNPPFSATAGRVQGRRQTMEGAKHIEQSLKKLLQNGRLVAIVGKGMARDKPAFQDWWKKIESEYNVRANIGISGQEHKKYGTTFDNQILVIDKTGPTPEVAYPAGKVEKIADLIPLLKEVRNARIPQRERALGKPGREEGVKEPGLEPVVLPASSRPSGEIGEIESQVSATTGKPGSIPGRVEPGERPEVSVREPRPDERLPEEPGPVEPGERSAGAAKQPLDSGADRISEAEGSASQLQIRAIEKEARGELTESLYDDYTPERIAIPNAQPHPTPLVQSAAMGAVIPPATTYAPSIPEGIVKKGNLSDIQLESVVYAGQAHEQILTNGTRKGYFIGDGTGVGKGREITGVIWDNWNKGRKKAVWITEKAALFKDAQRDIQGTGWAKSVIFQWSKTKYWEKIKQEDGIIFGTYDGLKQKKPGAEDDVTRMDQLVNWLGEDFDGVIAFDESHNMGNAIAIRGPRGTTQPSQKALAGVELQQRLPNARILYVSATGATEVRNLSYASRLDLWGEGTAFPNVNEFINKISDGGVAAMEMIAQNMKATGSYTARSLSYDGVKYDKIEHKLTDNQKEQYNKAAGAWRVVLDNINEALELTDGAKNGRAKSNAMGMFWGANLRFFNQIITSMKLPSVINKIHEDLKAGRSVVVQLVSTLEAAQERALSKLTEEDSLEDLDLSPFDDLMQMVERGFPVAQFQEVMDENGNIRYEPVLDSQGNRVENTEAVEMREKLLDELGALRGEFADSPIDQIIAEFGVDNVAEVTGRSKRVVEKITEKGTEKVIEKRSEAKANADADAFQDRRKRILIFSEKGGTGRSYHPDLDVKNQDERAHYLLQPGWRADKALQGLGRTHRSNQKQPPHYYLVTTDLQGEIRFISSIARRLDQLGALTKGARETGSQGIFQAKDNLETQHAEDALQVFLRDIYSGHIPGMTVVDFESQTGIKITNDEGSLNAAHVQMKKFMNRVLAMNIDSQNRFFSEFFRRLDDIIEAHAETGTLDVGLETLKADKIEKVEEEVVHTDEKSGATTRYVQLDTTNPAPMLKWSHAKKFALGGFYKNVKSGKVWAVRERNMLNRNTGDIERKFILKSPTFTQQSLDAERIEDAERWVKLSDKDAKADWQKTIKELPKTITERKHLITGVLLPVWNRLVGHPRIMRIQTDQGETMIGRLITPKDLSTTLKRLGATQAKIKTSPKQIHTQILANNYRYELANGWDMRRRRVSDDYRIEIDGPSYDDFQILKNYGVFSERISYQTRFFIPVDSSGYEAIEKIIKNSPAVEEIPPHGQYQQEPLYSTTKEAAPKSSADRVFETILPYLQGMTNFPTVRVVQSIEQLPQRLKSKVTAFSKKSNKQVEGFYDKVDDQVFLIADNLSEGRIEAVLRHEGEGHRGIRLLLGSDLDGFLDGVAKAKKDDLLAHDPGLNFKDQAAVRVAADEWVARKIEDNALHELWWERLINVFRKWVRKLIPNLKLTNVEIQSVLVDTVKNVREGRIDRIRTPEGRPIFSSIADKWHSQMARFVSDKLPGKGSPAQFKQTIGSWAKKGLIKQEELEWSGLNEWLDSREGKVTKQQVLDFLAENNVQIQEVVKGEGEVFEWKKEGEGEWSFGPNYEIFKEGEKYLAQAVSNNGYTLWEDSFYTLEEAKNVVNKFFNKKAWGGAKVGVGKIFNPNARLRLFQDGPNWNVIQEAITGNIYDKRIGKFKSGEEAQKFMDEWTAEESVHSLPITPEMKEKALGEGMPLFSTVSESEFKKSTKSFIQKGKLNARAFFNKTAIDLPSNDPKDLIKGFRWIQTMQDLAKNFPNMARLFDVEKKRVADSNFASISDRETTEPYFTLDKDSRENVNEALLEGDVNSETYTDKQLKEDFGLNSKEIDGYKSIREVLEEKLDDHVIRILSDIVDVSRTPITPEMVSDVKKAKNEEDLKEVLMFHFVSEYEASKLPWLVNWLKEFKGYIPHSWDAEWLVKVDLGKDNEWMFEVPVIGGRLKPTRAGRLRSAKKVAYQLVKERLNLRDEQIMKLAEGHKISVIRSRELPIDLFEGARMDVIQSIINDAQNKMWKETVKHMGQTQADDFKEMQDLLKGHIQEMYLAKGWGRHLMGRRGVKGYRTDIENVVSSYLNGANKFTAKGIAAKEFAKTMKDISPTETPEQWKHGKQFVSDMLGSTSEAAWFKKIAGTWFLAGDISAAALNMTQNWTHGVALLRSIKSKDGKKKGIVAEKEIYRAMKDVAGEYARTRGKDEKIFTTASKYISQDEIDALHDAKARGQLDPAFLGETTGYHENKIWQSYTQKTWAIMFKMFTGAEGWNRTSTFLAAYRRATRAGMNNDDAIQKASEIVEGAHFIYGRGNRPQAVRATGAVGNIAFTFMTYPLNNLVFLKHRCEDLLRDLHHGNKAAIKKDMKVLGSNLSYLFAFGGLLGLPFSYLWQSIWNLFDDDEEDWEILMRRHMPKTVGRAVVRGIPAAFLGNDMSWRVQGTDVVGMPIGFQIAQMGKRRIEQAHKTWEQGDEIAAIFHLMPDMVRNPYRAVMGYKEGGERIGVPPIRYTPGEAAVKALSFTPTREAEAWKAGSVTRKARRLRLDKLAAFAERYLIARKKGDITASRKIREEIEKYNRRQRRKGRRGLEITLKDVRKSAKTRRKFRGKTYTEQMPKYMHRFQKEIEESLRM